MKRGRVTFWFHLVPLLTGVCVGAFGCGGGKPLLEFESQPRPVLPEKSGEATRAPQVVASPSGNISVLALYGEGTGQRLGFTVSHDGGDHFMPLRPVSEEGTMISAHGENNPVMVSSGRSVFAMWEQSVAQGTRDLVLARSMNEGQSFEKPVRINDNTTPSFHGFASLAADSKGNVYVVWLDGRESSPHSGTFDVYLAHSSDYGATFEPNRRVAQSACPCCRPAITLGARGEVFIIWRKVFPNSIRDMVFSVSRDGGQTFPEQTRVAEDHWQIQGCPESGAALAVSGNRLYAAWMTAGTESRARVQVAKSEDGGVHFNSPQIASKNVDDPNHPQFAWTPNGKLLLCLQGRPHAKNSSQWSTSAAFIEEVREGSLGQPLLLANSGCSVSYPQLAVGPTGNLFAAWTCSGNERTTVNLLRGRLE